MRPGLCPRCGAILPVTEPSADGRSQGRCSECGLGFTRARMTAGSTPSTQAKTQSFESLRQHRESLIGLLRQRPFSVYGLDSTWNGRRWLAGGGCSGPNARSFVLGHGDARGDATEVRVETWAPGGTGQMAEIRVTRRLAMHLWHAGAEQRVVRASFSEEDPAGSWDLVTASISDDPHPLRVLRADPAWVGFAEASDQLVTIVARHIAPEAVRLVVVDDIEMYLKEDGRPR